MAENGYGPMAGHVGRIPNFGKTQIKPMVHNEPPACIQNAMMTKDKKPFTYTPGGLDLSQIRTPSMARRLARQRSQEDQEQAYAQQNYAPRTNGGGYQPQGIPNPPPPPPPGIPAPPPPPPLVIEVPNAKSPKPPTLGERPEIVIPENPIGMLRKTNSPYHWEAEKADELRVGPIPKFVEKVPSPLTVQMPPSSFSNQAPQSYTPLSQNMNYLYNNQNKQPESPLHRPEALYAHQKSTSPNVKTPTIELLQRQDSQFNKSPQPFGGQSPVSNSSPYSPSPNNNWRQPERRESPAQTLSNSPQSPHINRSPFTPNQQYSPNFQTQSPPVNSSPAFHTLPRVGQRNPEVNNQQNNQTQYSNATSDPTPWRTNTLNRNPREPESQNIIYNNQNTIQQAHSPPWKSNESNNNEGAYTPPWLLTARNQNSNQQQYTPPWVTAQDSNNNGVQENYNTLRRSDNNNNKANQSSPKPAQPQEQPRYQSSMSIPVTPRRQNPSAEYNSTPPQKEVVYVNQEPVYFCPESPKSIPPWVKTQKEKTKTPPPEWVQRPLENRKSVPRELVTPPRDSNQTQEPQWVKKSNEMQRGIRDVISPPKYQQNAQPSWSTRPSENRKSLPREASGSPASRIIPVQMEVSNTDSRDQGRQGNQAPHLRIVIGMQPNAPNAQPQTAPYSQPTQRIMRVLSPQLMRMDDGQPQPELPTLTRQLTSNQENQSKTRIIPIQIEGGNDGGNKRVFYHKFSQERPPRQSKAFRVLQVITGTEDTDHIQNMEKRHGFTDL